MTLSLTNWLTDQPNNWLTDWLLISDNDYTDYNNYNDYNDYNGYNDYNDYRNSDLDLDLDWERFSDLVTVTQFTIIDKLRDLNHDNEG